MLYIPTSRYLARKPTGAKLALKPVHVWGIRVRCRSRIASATWRFSISR